jgi:hypothetical protein
MKLAAVATPSARNVPPMSHNDCLRNRQSKQRIAVDRISERICPLSLQAKNTAVTTAFSASAMQLMNEVFKVGIGLQDHIVVACELEGASADAFPSQKTQSFAQRPHNPSPFDRTALCANPLNEFSRILPVEDEFACSFTNEVAGNLVTDHAPRDRRHVSARGVGCRKGALSSSSRSCQPIQR